MAEATNEATSVGKIQLDVEINKESIKTELQKLNNVFNTGFKSIFSQMTGFVQSSMTRMGNSFKTIAQAGMSSNNQVSKSTERMNAQYEKTQEQIRKIQDELAKLDAQMDAIIENYRDLPPISGMTQEETLEQLLKNDAEFQKLSAKAKELDAKLNPLIEKNKSLAAQLESVSTSAQQSGKSINLMGQMTDTAKKSIQKAIGIKRLFTKETKRATSSTSNFAAELIRAFRNIMPYLIIYGVILKGIRDLINFIGSALMTNQEFVRSLNIIKTNLRVAFQPIYEFILPALNALMKGIATVTTYIAAAISALFGKTYKQSFGAAKNLYNAQKAMAGYGSAAKKAGKEAQNALMAFDEINQLDIDEGSDSDTGSGGGAGGFEMTTPDMAQIDTTGIDKFKEIIASIFEPFKNAWENEGQNTINSVKYALSNIKGLISEIGKSWLTVWTNGTGQAILETILRILQNVFYTVGDIAGSFTRAWSESGLGTSIMQNLHNIILNILNVVEKLTKAFREVWDEVGDTLAKTFLQTLNNILATLDHLSEKLGWVWDNGGEHLLQGLLNLGSKILELAMLILNEFVLPFVNWFIDLIAPAVAKVLDWVGWLLDKFSDLIDWLMGDGYPVLEIIVTVLGSMALAFNAVTTAINIYNQTQTLAGNIAETFGNVMKWLKDPINIVILAIGAAIAIGILLYQHWDEISAWLKQTWESIKEKAVEIWNGIKEFFVNTWNSIKEKTSELWNAIKTFLIETVWNPIKDTAQSVWNSIKQHILDPIQSAWTNLKQTWDNIKTYILNKWNEIKTGILNMRNNLVDAIKSPFVTAKDWIDGLIRDAFNWGKNLIDNIIDGIKSKINAVKNAVNNVVSTISDYLGFHSPAKKGPGADADTWMPNFMNMLAEGIRSNIAEVSKAISVTADTLRGVQPTIDNNGLASAVGTAVLTAMQVTNSQSKSTGIIENEIVVQVDGTKLARILIPKLNSEAQRLGFRTILRTTT